MAGNHLEDLVAEWYVFQGYFVRRNVQVGKRSRGGYDCELEVVAFHPSERRLVQIEPSLDAHPWEVREERYAKKFAAGREDIPQLFVGLNVPTEIEQIAHRKSVRGLTHLPVEPRTDSSSGALDWLGVLGALGIWWLSARSPTSSHPSVFCSKIAS